MILTDSHLLLCSPFTVSFIVLFLFIYLSGFHTKWYWIWQGESSTRVTQTNKMRQVIVHFLDVYIALEHLQPILKYTCCKDIWIQHCTFIQTLKLHFKTLETNDPNAFPPITLRKNIWKSSFQNDEIPDAGVKKSLETVKKKKCWKFRKKHTHFRFVHLGL